MIDDDPLPNDATDAACETADTISAPVFLPRLLAAWVVNAVIEMQKRMVSGL